MEELSFDLGMNGMFEEGREKGLGWVEGGARDVLILDGIGWNGMGWEIDGMRWFI